MLDQDALRIKRVRFAYEDVPEDEQVVIDIKPADVKRNLLFRAAVQAHLGPYQLASATGRLSDEVAQRQLALAYADGVIIGSMTPDLQDFNTNQWADWLINHPDEFLELQAQAQPEDDSSESRPSVPSP